MRIKTAGSGFAEKGHLFAGERVAKIGTYFCAFSRSVEKLHSFIFNLLKTQRMTILKIWFV
jgi:hypothetical protein